MKHPVARAAERYEKAKGERDAAIRQALADGMSLREAARLAGVSHETIRAIKRKG